MITKPPFIRFLMIEKNQYSQKPTKSLHFAFNWPKIKPKSYQSIQLTITNHIIRRIKNLLTIFQKKIPFQNGRVSCYNENIERKSTEVPLF